MNNIFDEVNAVDKYEYKLKTEQMLELMENGSYRQAAEIADQIEWKRVRNVTMLINVSDIYEKNREYQKSYDVLSIAYHRAEGSRKVIYHLCTLAIKTGNVDEAIDYYDDFMQIAPKDPNQFILRYQILRAQRAPIEQQIEALEEFKKSEYIEEWAYELAKLYQEAGMTAECLEECDDLILWFSEGKYVYKAMELKMQYKPLTPSQQEKYDRRYEKMSADTEEMPDLEAYAERKAQEEEAVETEAAEVVEEPVAETEDENGEYESEASADDSHAGGMHILKEAGKKIGDTMRLDEALKKLLHPQKNEEESPETSYEEAAAENIEETAAVENEAEAENIVEQEEPDMTDLEAEIDAIESVADLGMADRIAGTTIPEAGGKVSLSGDMKEIIPEDVDNLDEEIDEPEAESLESEEIGEVEAEPLASEETEEAEAEALEPEEIEEAEAEALEPEEIEEAEVESLESEEIENVEAEVLEDEEAEAFGMTEDDDQIAGQMSLEDILEGWDSQAIEEDEEENQDISEEDILEEEFSVPEEITIQQDSEETLPETALSEEIEEFDEIDYAEGEDLDEADYAEGEDLDEADYAEGEDLDEADYAEAEDLDEFDYEEAEDLDEFDYEEAEDLDEADYEEAEDLEESDYAEGEDLDESDYEEAEDLDEADYEEAEDLDEADYEEEVVEKTASKKTEPILPPDIQRLIDEIEGVAPPEEEVVKPVRTRKIDNTPTENMGKVADELRLDDVDLEDAEEYEEDEEYFDDDDYDTGFIPDEDEIEESESEEEYDRLFDEDDYEGEAPDLEEEFRINPDHGTEPDDREVPDEDDDMMDIMSSATTPLSRKETAKLIATGKTSPLPLDEISDALSMTDTGFIVRARYDLSGQSGKGPRPALTEEQKKLFSYFVPVRGMSEQIIDVLEQDKNCTNRKGTSKTGNLLIIGNKGNGKTVLAVDVVKAIQKQRKIHQGKVAIVTGESLNKKKISDIFAKLYGGALIIEKAGKMNEKTVARLNKAMEKDTGELLIVLEEQRKPLDRLLSSNREFRRKFTSRLEVPIFINDELVTFGQTYAQENGYRIDEMGILALYSKIDSLQREDHAVTVAEVKDVMDEAIRHSQKASAKKLVKRVFGKNTDDADRILLSEKDFSI